MSNYYAPETVLPPQTDLLTGRAVVTEAYTVIPRGVLRDIVVSELPEWTNTRTWILNRPVAGGATTFAQYLVEVSQGGGSTNPEPEAGVESFVFLLEGALTVKLEGELHDLTPAELAARYPRWNDFLALRAELDPQGRLLTPYMARLFGIAPAGGTA